MTKKVLSLMTTLVMMMSLIGVLPTVTVSAEEYYYNLELGEINTVYSSDDWETNYYYFTPETSGVYYFECIDCYDVVYAGVETNNYSDIYVYEKTVSSGEEHYNLEARGDYLFTFSEEHNGHNIYFGEVSYEELDKLYLGTTIVSVNNDLYTQTYYCFTPEQSGLYRITSNGSSSDPELIITDENVNVYYEFNDTEYSDDYDKTINLTANQTYYFSFYDNVLGTTNNVINITYIPPSNPKPTPTTRPKISNVNTTIVKPVNKPNIKKVTKPGKPKIKYTYNPNTKKLKVKWKKVKGATGYQYKIALTKKFKKAKKKSINNKSFSYKLKLNKKYTISVRAYKLVGNEVYYGKWTTKKIKVKQY